MTYEIQVLKVGEADVPGPEVFWMSHWNTWVTLFFYVVLVRGGGKAILINTGPPADLTRLNQAWVAGYGDQRTALRRRSEERPLPVLRDARVLPADVDYILITPLQAYATANIPLFPKATICFSRRGWIEDFQAPPWPMHVPRDLRIPNDVLVYLEIEAWERVRLLEDEEEVLPGIVARWVGVHHRSSMAYFVDTARGRVAISDCFFKYANLEQNVPLGAQESMEECMRSYAMVRKMSDLIIPLYDPEVLTRLPDGKIP
jgi:glyoxylase-like metal-dependent hydrolase (beta-lactamase superfamily II)